ncbi:MAG: multidrug effflux MFS transporter [Muribaculum sp.]|nr:multidrug effflux MFS transporter [Muribaculum sp.]
MSEISLKAKQLGYNYGFLVTYLVGLSAFGSFVNDMYMPSLPSMVKFFHCSVPSVELGVAFGMAGLGLGEIFMGPASDKYGRKPVLFASLLLFMISAFVSIFSPNIHFFIACRFFQGCGAAGGYFLARTIPTDIFGGRMLAKIMAVVGAINGFAPASAPVLGGLISQKFGWQGVFIVLIALALILMISMFRLKESLPAPNRFKGSLWSSFSSYPKLLRNTPFMVHTILKGAALGILFAYISSAPFIMQTHFGFSQLQFGLIVGANSIMAAIGAMMALKFNTLKKALLAAAIILLVSVSAESLYLLLGDHFLPYELLLLPIIFSLGMIFTASNTLAMNEGRSDAGGASAVLGVAGYIFGAICSSIVGIGNVMHTTAWVLIILTVIVAVYAFFSQKLPVFRMEENQSAQNDKSQDSVS